MAKVQTKTEQLSLTLSLQTSALDWAPKCFLFWKPQTIQNWVGLGFEHMNKTSQVSAWPWLTLKSIILPVLVWPTVKLVVSSWSYHKTSWWNTKNPLRFALPFPSCFSLFAKPDDFYTMWLCNYDFSCVPPGLRTKVLPSNIFCKPNDENISKIYSV